jgi:hypothetical protein
VIARHNAKLEIRSEPDKGSTFSVIFQRERSAEPEVQPGARPEPPGCVLHAWAAATQAASLPACPAATCRAVPFSAVLHGG